MAVELMLGDQYACGEVFGAVAGQYRDRSLTKDRAVVEFGQVVVRPMNYFALSYDHRIIDGREAVLFLVAVKDALEDPARLLLDL